MKIAVLADIHANYPALMAVVEHVQRWRPDKVFVAGDTINRGPRSNACFRFVQDRVMRQNWQVIRGNHESYVIWHDHPDSPRSGPLFELFRYSYWTYQELQADLPVLKAMPKKISCDFDDRGEFRLVHASMRGERRGIYPEMDDAVLNKLAAPAPAVLAVGHTHRPLVRRVGGCLIVNAGSVGLPFDGDQRAAYAQITFQDGVWNADIVRLCYDVDQAEADFYETGFLEQAGPLAELILLELRLAYSQLHDWIEVYMDAILAGDISVEQAVQEHLDDPITSPYWLQQLCDKRT